LQGNCGFRRRGFEGCCGRGGRYQSRRRRNGNRDIAAILKHVVTDSLVKWGWNPGPGRTPAPGSNAEFGALLQAWADTGAHCPAP